MMNEIFKKLTAQVGIEIDESGHGTGDIESFAKLIVLDCISRLDKDRKEYGNPNPQPWYESEYYNRMLAKEVAIEDAIDALKYRFDV